MTRLHLCPSCRDVLTVRRHYCRECMDRAATSILDAMRPVPSVCDYRCRSHGLAERDYWSREIGVCPCVVAVSR